MVEAAAEEKEEETGWGGEKKETKRQGPKIGGFTE